MAYNDLRDFIRALEKNGELKRIPLRSGPASRDHRVRRPRREDAAARRCCSKSPRARDVPVLINAFASMRRMELALEVDSVDEVARAHLRVPGNAHARRPDRQAQDAAQAGRGGLVLPEDRFQRRRARKSSSTKDFSLFDYPVLHCWPEDGGRFITLPLVFSRNPDTGKRNCGMYRMQVYDERTTGMHWQTHKQGAEHYRRLQRRGQATRMDVAVAIGADPATMYSAILPLPPDLDEMMIAGFLRGKPGGDGEVRDGRPRSSGQRGDRARRLRRTRRAAHRRPVRRPHRLLFAGRRVPGLPRHLRHAAQESDLRDDHRRSAAHGRFLHGQGDRAHLPAADAPADCPKCATSACPPKASSTT